MADITLFDSRGYRLDPPGDRPDEEIRRMNQYGVVCTIVYHRRKPAITTYFRARESESGRLEQYYARYEPDRNDSLDFGYRSSTGPSGEGPDRISEDQSTDATGDRSGDTADGRVDDTTDDRPDGRSEDRVDDTSDDSPSGSSVRSAADGPVEGLPTDEGFAERLPSGFATEVKEYAEEHGLDVAESTGNENFLGNLLGLEVPGSWNADADEEAVGQRERAREFLSRGRRLRFGAGSYEDAFSLVSDLVTARPGLEAAITEEESPLDGGTAEYDLLVERRPYAGIEPLGETKELLEPSKTESRGLKDGAITAVRRWVGGDGPFGAVPYVAGTLLVVAALVLVAGPIAAEMMGVSIPGVRDPIYCAPLGGDAPYCSGVAAPPNPTTEVATSAAEPTGTQTPTPTGTPTTTADTAAGGNATAATPNSTAAEAGTSG